MTYSQSLISIGLTDSMYVSSGFRLSPLLLFQIKSVETRLSCCVVHWSGAAGDIWPTGPMLTLSYIHMSKANTLELLQSCTKPSMWKTSTG